MLERYRFTGVVIASGLLVWAVFAFRASPIRTDVPYEGSERCGSCHPEIYREWKDSQHTKMMRPVRPDVVVAEFDATDPPPQFPLEEAVWAIGGKWEQQFMGHDGDGETLLPGAWLVHADSWQATGWDGWQVPVPSRRCHGCHTVGLDAETGEFVEPNIGCESCHGPGSWHARSYGFLRIHALADAQVCGQCHTRGTDPTNRFHFPVGYRPGKVLADYFAEEEPSAGQNSSQWWGNGRERKRHQAYYAWRQGGHADGLETLLEGYDGRFGEVDETCLECHSGDYILAPARHKPGLEGVSEGITCSVCHNVHGSLDELRISCETCHEEGAFYHTPEKNVDHTPCPPSVSQQCADCHMPLVIKNGGAFTMRTHTPGIVPPRDGAAFGMPTSCANGVCHSEHSHDSLQEAFESHYRTPERAAGSRTALEDTMILDGGPGDIRPNS